MPHHRSITRSESIQLEPEAPADEQVEGTEVRDTRHDETSSSTPKTLNASVTGSYGYADLSPASTLGTTASSGGSMPVTPVQARFTKGKKKPSASRCNKRDKMRRRKDRLQTLQIVMPRSQSYRINEAGVHRRQNLSSPITTVTLLLLAR